MVRELIVRVIGSGKCKYPSYVYEQSEKGSLKYGG